MNGTNRNGSGNGVHRDAAIVNGHDPVSSDLLWDGLSPAVANALEQPLDPGPGLPAQGQRRAHLRLPRRPRRHRPGQPHLRIWRVGL